MRTLRLPLTAPMLAVLVLVLAGVAGLAGNAGPGRLDAKPAAGSTDAPLSIVTYNIRAALPVSSAMADIRRLAAADPDVITLQEVGSATRRAQIQQQLVDCASCEYDAFLPTTKAQNATPILYRWDKFRLEGTGTKLVSPATYVGAAGAGPSTMAAKYINYVKLRQRSTGRTVYVLNNHTVPTVQRPSGGHNGFTKRVSLYRKHMAGLRSMVSTFRSTGALVFVTGDLNVSYRRDKVVRDTAFPYANMAAVGTRASYYYLGDPARGTHVESNGSDNRVIDYVYFSVNKAVKPTAQDVLLGYHSDHRPVQVTFRVTSGL